MRWCVHRTTRYLTLPYLQVPTSYSTYNTSLHCTPSPRPLFSPSNSLPIYCSSHQCYTLHTTRNRLHHHGSVSFIHFILTPPPCDFGADLSRPPWLASSSPRLASHSRRHRANCTSTEKHNSGREQTGERPHLEACHRHRTDIFFFLLGLASKLAAAQGGAAPVSNFTQQGAGAGAGQGGYVRTFSRVTHS